MARLTIEQWEDLEADYHTGTFSKNELAEKYEISHTAVNKRLKNVEPKHKDKVSTLISIKSDLANESFKEVSAVETIVAEQLRRRGLLFSGVEKAVKKMADLIDYGKIEEKINVAPGVQQFEERKLNTSDIKNALDGFDKASITLGVNERFSSKVEVNNANVQQTEEKRVTIIRRSDNLNND